MPFDPSLPQENTPVDAVQMRAQLNGLKDLIDALAVITAAQVEAVNTVPTGTSANATVSVVGNELRFTFDIPEGPPGADGAEGPQGPAGSDGSDGPAGPPFADAVVDAVNTLPAGDPAAVGVNFDGSHVRFTFDLPTGFPRSARRSRTARRSHGTATGRFDRRHEREQQWRGHAEPHAE
jgi:hypothetical protein